MERWPRRCAKLALGSMSLDEVYTGWQRVSELDLYKCHSAQTIKAKEKPTTGPVKLEVLLSQHLLAVGYWLPPSIVRDVGMYTPSSGVEEQPRSGPFLRQQIPPFYWPSWCTRMDSKWAGSLSRNYHGQGGRLSQRGRSRLSVRGYISRKQCPATVVVPDGLKRYDSGDEQLSGPVVTCPGARLASSHRALGGSWYCNCNSEGRCWF